MLQISYLFRPEAQVTGDRMVIGMCVRVDDRNWTLTKNDFIIEIAQDVWEDERTTDAYKRALVHHELCHAAIRLDKEGQPAFDEKSGRLKTYSKPHEIEEFNVILKTYGDWHEQLRAYLEVFGKELLAKAAKGKTPKAAGIDGPTAGDLEVE